MRVVRRLTIPSCVILVSATCAVAAAGRNDCLAGKTQALLHGHFSGPIVCSPSGATFRLVGTPNGYAIYDYRYRFLPYEGATVMHGGQRLLVFHGGEYVGQYSMSPPPDTTITVSGSYVLLSKRGAGSVTVDFSMGPPSKIHFDGETEGLHR